MQLCLIFRMPSSLGLGSYRNISETYAEAGFQIDDRQRALSNRRGRIKAIQRANSYHQFESFPNWFKTPLPIRVFRNKYPRLIAYLVLLKCNIRMLNWTRLLISIFKLKWWHFSKMQFLIICKNFLNRRISKSDLFENPSSEGWKMIFGSKQWSEGLGITWHPYLWAE